MYFIRTTEPQIDSLVRNVQFISYNNVTKLAYNIIKDKLIHKIYALEVIVQEHIDLAKEKPPFLSILLLTLESM